MRGTWGLELGSGRGGVGERSACGWERFRGKREDGKEKRRRGEGRRERREKRIREETRIEDKIREGVKDAHLSHAWDWTDGKHHMLIGKQ